MESVNDIRLMLERFYRGETSLEEEQRLRDWFASASVPEDLIPDQELFRSLEMATETVDVPADLDQKIIAGIDQAERRATRTRRISRLRGGAVLAHAFSTWSSASRSLWRPTCPCGLPSSAVTSSSC